MYQKTRFHVFKRDNFRCQYCGRTSDEVVLEVDHIVPISKGGKNNIENLITSCRECNRGKSDEEIIHNDNKIIDKEFQKICNEWFDISCQISDLENKIKELLLRRKEIELKQIQYQIDDYEYKSKFYTKEDLRSIPAYADKPLEAWKQACRECIEVLEEQKIREINNSVYEFKIDLDI